MNKKGMKIFKIVIGAYIILIGTTLFMDVYSQKPTNQALLLLCAIILIVAGVGYIVQSIRKVFNLLNIQKEDRGEIEKDTGVEHRHKELYNSDKSKTAPIPKVRSEKNDNITEFVSNKRKEGPLFAEIKKPVFEQASEKKEDEQTEIKYEDEKKEKENNKIVQIRSKREGTTVYDADNIENLAIRVVTSDEIHEELEEEAEDEVELAINIEASKPEKETDKEE